MLKLNVRVVAVLFFGAQLPERRPMPIGEIFSLASGEASVGRRGTLRGEGTHERGKGKKQ